MTASHYKHKATLAARTLETLSVVIGDHLGRDEYNTAMRKAYEAKFWAQALIRSLELEIEANVKR